MASRKTQDTIVEDTAVPTEAVAPEVTKVIIPKRPTVAQPISVDLRFVGTLEQSVATCKAILESSELVKIYIRNHDIGTQTIVRLISDGTLAVNDSNEYMGGKEVYTSEQSRTQAWQQANNQQATNYGQNF